MARRRNSRSWPQRRSVSPLGTRQRGSGRGEADALPHTCIDGSARHSRSREPANGRKHFVHFGHLRIGDVEDVLVGEVTNDGVAAKAGTFTAKFVKQQFAATDGRTF
jgi:hypothetical protein